jgi:UDP-N-acetylmuramate: L-alanyl-gamma-D-glutamyl-meso-diaminopimelate ligase
MNVHFIAIGGSAMHNLALALHQKGYNVTGSDDEINEPSYTRLKNAGILPPSNGWDASRIHAELDAVILGMHARIDNPELVRARELGIKVYSYPEYLYEQSKDKKRIVIGGSHGKTTITAMLLHVMKYHNINFDYMVGAQLEGFDTMVRLSKDAPFIILEGDEYLSSPIDRRPKFHLYHADIALLSGIAWDHINVFPTFENYVEQFLIFIQQLPDNGKLIYCREDVTVKSLCETTELKAEKIEYGIPDSVNDDGITSLIFNNTKYPLQIFGNHNLMNLEGALKVAEQVGVSNIQFLEAIMSFKGAARRLEKVAQSNDLIIYKDFAHSPSKLKATTEAVKAQFKNRKLIACMELHTFSSLNEDFLSQYNGAMEDADEAIVYFNPHTIEHKKLKPVSIEQVKAAFNRKDLIVFNESSKLKDYLSERNYQNNVLLIMTSGNFDGININSFAQELIKQPH